MARKRVNTKFIIILGAIVLAMMMAVLLAKRFIIKEKPDKYLAVGREMMEQGKPEEAAKNFRRALGLDSKNPDIWVEFGDSMNQLSGQDPEFLRRAREAWEQARNIDPTHKMALTRLLTFWSEIADLESRPDPSIFEQIRKTAADLAKVDPTNTGAQAAVHSAIIRRWLGGVETDPAVIDKAVEQLSQLMAKNPENPDLPVYIAKAKLEKAQRARQRGAELGDAEANKLISEADAVVETAVKNQPKSAAMQFGAAQVLEQEYFDALRQAQRYANFDPNPKNTDRQNVYNKEQYAKYSAQAEKYAKRKLEMLSKAQEFAQPDDALYVYIHIAAAQSAAQTNDRARAEKILRDLLTKRPEDQQVRLALSEHIASAGKRDEAIAILDRDFTGASIKGPKSLVARALEVRTVAAMTAMRLDAYQNETNAETKKKLEGQINDGISKIVLKEGDSVRSNLLRGKLLRAQGKQIDAIQTLEKARQLTEKQTEGQERTLERWEIHDLLARSYIETRQTGRAKALLEALVQRFDSYQPARILLAQLLIREQQMDQARVHIEILREQAPTNPDIIKLQIQVLDAQTQQPQIAALLKQLPEKTKPEAMDKVNTAMVVKQNADAIRLMQQLEKDYPKDDEIFRLAFKVYRALERYDLADATVKRAKEVHPDSVDIGIVSGFAATRPTTQSTIAIRQQMIEKEKDPFQKELLRAEFARTDGKTEEELNALKAAGALKPDDTDVKLNLFNLYLKRKQFEMAANYIEPLARVNKDQVNGLLLRYRYNMAKGDINGGIEIGRKLVSQMPEFGQSWLALAEALQAAQQYDEALQRYLSALDKQSDNSAAYRGAIECYYAVNRKEEAKRMIAKARSVLPNNQQFVDMELNHALTYDDPESMIKGREEELKKQPDNPNVLLMAGRTYIAAARYRLKKDPNDQTNATAFMTKARELFMQGIEKWPDEPAFYAYCAEASAQKKDLAQAEEVLKKLANREQWKNRPEPLMLLGEFYAKTNRGEDAIKVLQQAMSMAPTNVDVEMRLATVLAEQKRFDDAIKALVPNAEDPRIIRRRIEILISAGKAEEADKAWQAAVAKMPNMADLRALGGSISLARSRFDEAASRLQEGMKIDPKHPASHYYMALVLVNQPRPNIDGAISHLNQCKDAAGVGTEARRELANCFRRLNRFDDAVRELEAAQKSNPSNREIVLSLLDAYAGMKPPRWLDVKRVITEWKNTPDYRADKEILKREAQMYVAQQNYVDAAATLNDVIRLDPKDTAAIRDYLGLLIQTQNYSALQKSTTSLIEQDKTRWWAYLSRAIGKRYQTDRAGAVADYQMALNTAADIKDEAAISEVIRSMAKEIGVGEAIMRIKDRAEKEPRWALMIAYLYQHDNPPKIDQSIAALEKVLAMPGISKADQETALRYGGSLYLQTKPKPNTQKSYDCYVKLLDLAPNDLTALNNMACLLCDMMGRPDEGLKYSTRAYQIMQSTNTREPSIMDTHGWLLILAGHVDDGIVLLQSVADSSPIVDARYHLAEAYIKKAFPEEAKKQLELANAMIKKMEQEGRPFDPALKPKIDNAMLRVQEMLRSKGNALAN